MAGSVTFASLVESMSISLTIAVFSQLCRGLTPKKVPPGASMACTCVTNAWTSAAVSTCSTAPAQMKAKLPFLELRGPELMYLGSVKLPQAVSTTSLSESMNSFLPNSLQGRSSAMLAGLTIYMARDVRGLSCVCLLVVIWVGQYEPLLPPWGHKHVWLQRIACQ